MKHTLSRHIGRVGCWLLSTLLCSHALADTLDDIRRTKTINIGFREASVPFSFVGPDKQPMGYSIDLCAQIVGAIKRELALPQLKINYVPVATADRLPFVTSGKIDLECGNTTATAERRKQVAFTSPIFVAGAGVLVRRDANARSMDQLRGKSMAVVTGTTGEKILTAVNKARNLDLKPVAVKSNGEAFEALAAGRAQAWVTDDVLLAGYRAGADKPDDYVLLDQRFTVEPLAIMLRKGDQAFERIVDKEMSRLIFDKQIQPIYAKWFVSPIPPKGVSLQIPESALLRDIFRNPVKALPDIDVVVF
jgi:ABC-type amino acid transport substrate-binding protein